MAAPVQIILDQESLVTLRESGGGVPKKDFFANRGSEFVRHRNAICSQLSRIAESLRRKTTGKIGIVKLILRRSAWAKSHRPVRALFKPELTPVVGGGDLGEIFLEARPEALLQIQSRIALAESETEFRPVSSVGKLVPYPSSVRSETGAIDRIELYGPSDRRNFSADKAIECLANPMTGGAYLVELFEVPPPRKQWELVDQERRLLYRTFADGLQNLGQGLFVELLTAPRRDPGGISLRIEKSANSPALFFQHSVAYRPSRRSIAPFDHSADRHGRALAFLDNHPLVRRIELPLTITRTFAGKATSSNSHSAHGCSQALATGRRSL